MSQIVNELVPDPETIVALGNAKFATTIKSLGSTPIAKIVKVLAENRRVVIVPEVNTTKRCSYCQTNKQNTKQAYRKDKCKDCRKDNRDTSTKQYKKTIHGLRHCTKCSQSLNRDKNAARGIFFSFRHLYRHGCLPAFLRKFSGRGKGIKTREMSDSTEPSTTSLPDSTRQKDVNLYTKF